MHHPDLLLVRNLRINSKIPVNIEPDAPPNPAFEMELSEYDSDDEQDDEDIDVDE